MNSEQNSAQILKLMCMLIYLRKLLYDLNMQTICYSLNINYLPIKHFNIHIILPLENLCSLTITKTTHTHTNKDTQNKTEKQKLALPVFVKHISAQIDKTVSVEMHFTHISQLFYILCNALNQCTRSCQRETEIINIH